MQTFPALPAWQSPVAPQWLRSGLHDAGPAAVDLPSRTRDLTGARRADLTVSANRTAVQALAVTGRAAVIPIGSRHDARPAAVDLSDGARDEACPIATDLACHAGGSRVASCAVTDRAAVVTIGVGIDAGTAAVDEPRLTRQLARTATANLTRRAHDSRIASCAISRRAAMSAIGEGIDASGCAVDEPGLAGELAASAHTNLAGTANLSSVQTQAVAESTAIPVVRGGVDARSPAGVAEWRSLGWGNDQREVRGSDLSTSRALAGTPARTRNASLRACECRYR